MSETFTFQYTVWALILGTLCGLSLLIGAVLGIVWKPKPSVTSALTAFGAGALLAALSLELVAPTAMAVLEQGEGHASSDGHSAVTAMIALLLGSVAGGVLFVVFDQMLNASGGYLRKAATAISYLSNRRKKRIAQMLDRLGHIAFIRNIPSDQIPLLINAVRPVTFKQGACLFNRGDVGDRMYFLEQGTIALSADEGEFKSLSAGDVLGEIALVTGAPRTASATAKTETVAFELLKADFDRLRTLSPDLDAATTRIASERLEELHGRHIEIGKAAVEWASAARNTLARTATVPTQQDINEAAQEHSGAPMSIWLGTVLDGIPESFALGGAFLALLTARAVSGAPTFGELIPFTLIAGLFLSNLPEAMSSSVGMRAQGWSAAKILSLWLSLTMMVVLSTVGGYVLGAQLDHTVMVAIEGLAAGAMLTMIAQTMIPEAVHLGSSHLVGLSTLTGFLSAVAFKLLEA